MILLLSLMSVEVAATDGSLSPLLVPTKVSEETRLDFAVCWMPRCPPLTSCAVPKLFSSSFDGSRAEVCFFFTPCETSSDPTAACMKECGFEEDLGGFIRVRGSIELW